MWYNLLSSINTRNLGGYLGKLLTITQPSIVDQVLLTLLPRHFKNVCHPFYCQFHWEIPRPFLLLSHTIFLPLLLVFFHLPLWKYIFITKTYIFKNITFSYAIYYLNTHQWHINIYKNTVFNIPYRDSII